MRPRETNFHNLIEDLCLKAKPRGIVRFAGYTATSSMIAVVSGYYHEQGGVGLYLAASHEGEEQITYYPTDDPRISWNKISVDFTGAGSLESLSLPTQTGMLTRTDGPADFSCNNSLFNGQPLSIMTYFTSTHYMPNSAAELIKEHAPKG